MHRDCWRQLHSGGFVQRAEYAVTVILQCWYSKHAARLNCYCAVHPHCLCGFCIPHLKVTVIWIKSRNTLLRLSVAVPMRRRLGQCHFLPSLLSFISFLGQLLARLLQRQPEVFVHLLQPRESIKHKPQKRTVATAALALIKQRHFCPTETSTGKRTHAIITISKQSKNMYEIFSLSGSCSKVVFNQGYDNVKHYFVIPYKDWNAFLLPCIWSQMIEILVILKEARCELLDGIWHFKRFTFEELKLLDWWK